MPRGNPQAIAVGQGADRRGTKDGPLLFEATNETIGDARDLLAAKDADQVINLGPLFEQLLLLPLGQTTRNDDAARASLLFQLQHLVDRRKRLGSRSLDEAAGVDDDEIGPIGLA